jgi:hypothetical protein
LTSKAARQGLQFFFSFFFLLWGGSFCFSVN